MGYSVAEAAARRGAKVVLISGPTALETPEGVERIDVRTAEEMLRAVQSRFSPASIAVFAAAGADYRSAQPAAAKIKREHEVLNGLLEPNPENLGTMATQ